MRKICLIACFMLIPGIVFADTHYVSKAGTNSGTCTLTSPCLTIGYGISKMSSGDTLLVGDGTYVEQLGGMPNGTAGAYTKVKALNTGKAIIDGTGLGSWSSAIRIYAGSYIIIEGFKAKADSAGTETNAISIAGASHHCKIIRCSGYNAPSSGNVSVISTGTDSHDNLIEECWAWGTGRYKFLVYRSSNTIIRRCVSRHDYHSGSWADQCAPFVTYDSTNTQFQNCIAIDSGQSDQTNGQLYGAFWNENNGGVDTSSNIKGCIMLNIWAQYGAIYDPKRSGTREISNSVIWVSHGGWVGDVSGTPTPTILLDHLTIGNISGTFGGDWNSSGWGIGAFANSGFSSAAIKNSIIYGANSFGVGGYLSSDYNSFYLNGANYGGTPTPSPGSHDISAINPRSASLLYLPRIEAGSPLKTSGEGGGQIGAQILYQHGVSGTLYGETGWDTVTTTPLWPFPNEALIKADFASYTGSGPSGARGFATGNSKDGTPQTLTKYIWEYLGNTIPADINTFKNPKPPIILKIM